MTLRGAAVLDVAYVARFVRVLGKFRQLLLFEGNGIHQDAVAVHLWPPALLLTRWRTRDGLCAHHALAASGVRMICLQTYDSCMAADLLVSSVAGFASSLGTCRQMALFEGNEV